MPSPYASFLIRIWRTPTAGDRWHVRHLQSGAAAQLRSLAEVMEWLEGSRGLPHRPTAAPDDADPGSPVDPAPAGDGCRFPLV